MSTACRCCGFRLTLSTLFRFVVPPYPKMAGYGKNKANLSQNVIFERCGFATDLRVDIAGGFLRAFKMLWHDAVAR